MRRLGIMLMVFFVMIGIGFGWYKNGFDMAIRKSEQVKSSWAQVENQLQRRNDLIPNLVSTVKGYAAQEKDVLTEVTRLRSQWGKVQSVEDKIQKANEISSALSRLLVVAENYPQLKSNENFLALQSQLEGTENRIAVERMRYNQAVQDFNAYARSLIGRFFVKSAGVNEPAVYFQAVEAATKVPEVKF